MRMTTLRIIPVLLALFLAHAMAGSPESPFWGTASPIPDNGLPWWKRPCGRLRPTGTRKSSAWRSPVKRSPACRNRATPGAPSPRPCLHDRLDSILSKYAPTLVIACYGMNDGMMQPFSESGFQAYQQGMEPAEKKSGRHRGPIHRHHAASLYGGYPGKGCGPLQPGAGHLCRMARQP